MNKSKELTSRQVAVLHDLLAGELDQEEILLKHRIRASTFSKWIADEKFIAELDRLAWWYSRHGALVIERYKEFAAYTLINLTKSKNQETARKACVDIISYAHVGARPAEPEDAEVEDEKPFSNETAGKLLAILAKEKAGM